MGEEGTIAHFDGELWSEIPSGTNVSFFGVWGSSATDVYTVGEQGTILHYDGVNWSDEESGVEQDLNGVWGSTDTNVYVVGAQGIILQLGDVDDVEKCFFENLFEDNAEKVTSLRDFRDDVLNTTRQGKLLVSTYYKMSPFVIKIIPNNGWLRSKLENSIETILPYFGVDID